MTLNLKNNFNYPNLNYNRILTLNLKTNSDSNNFNYLNVDSNIIYCWIWDFVSSYLFYFISNTMCPHCTNIRRDRSKMFCQSDSGAQDSDGVSTPPRRRGSRQNASIANDWRFRGHANGSSIRCKYFYANN